MAAEKFIFKNFTNISNTECFTNLNGDELHELIEAAIISEHCSTNDILRSLHRWVVTTPAYHNTQTDDGRINTFLNLVKKLPRDEFNEKIFAEIFLDDHRLIDNTMCRSFREEYLCDFFKKYIEQNKSSSNDPCRTPERGMKRKVEDLEVEEARKRVIVADELQEPLVAIETTSGPGIESTMAQILEKSPTIASSSTQPSPVASTSVQKAVVVATDENNRKSPFRRSSVGSGKSTKIIIGGDGSDCIVYFTFKENDLWFIGSFNLATGDVEKITDYPSYREDGALIHAHNYLYYIGGRIVRDTSSGSEYPDGQEVKGQVSRRIDIFDMTARHWITENLPQLNEAREDFQSCVCDRYIYIIGGCRTDGSAIDSVESVPLYGITKQKVPQQEEHFDERDGCAIYSLQGHIYDTASGEWTELPKIPGARTGHSTSVYKSNIYVFGGVRKGAYSYKLSSACMYDHKTNAWTMLPNMHRKRHLAAAVIHNNFIYIIGGDGGHCKSGALTIEKFNPATKEFTIIHNWLDKVPPDVNFYLMARRIEC